MIHEYIVVKLIEIFAQNLGIITTDLLNIAILINCKVYS